MIMNQGNYSGLKEKKTRLLFSGGRDRVLNQFTRTAYGNGCRYYKESVINEESLAPVDHHKKAIAKAQVGQHQATFGVSLHSSILENLV